MSKFGVVKCIVITTDTHERLKDGDLVPLMYRFIAEIQRPLSF